MGPKYPMCIYTCDVLKVLICVKFVWGGGLRVRKKAVLTVNYACVCMCVLLTMHIHVCCLSIHVHVHVTTSLNMKNA